MNLPRHCRVTLFTALILEVSAGGSAFARPAVPLGTAFTYQGQLKQGGAAYSGTAEFQFRLYDALVAGNQIGSQVALTGGNSPTVSNGLFNATLDFGAGAFNGEARWLEIDVRTVLGPYTTLAPRQALNATPYALATRGLATDANGFVGIGTSAPEAPLHVLRGSAGAATAFSLSSLALEGSTHNYMQMLAPTGFENGILFGYPITGAAEGGIIYNSVTTPNGLQFRTNGNLTRMVITQTGNVGIGISDPLSRLHVVSSIHGIYGETSSPNSYMAVEGIATATSGSSVGVRGICWSPASVGVWGLALANTGTSIGVSGRSNSTAGFDFFASGVGIDFGTSSSIRWKRNITLIADPLERVEQIRGVWYDWDAAHGGRHDVGMIAEEVGKVMPEIVAYEANGIDATGMDYGKLTPLLVEAVKSLRAEKDAQIAQQQEQINALQHANQELRNRLAEVDAAISRLERATQGRPRQ